jgi:hypothetical protein
VYTKVYKNPTIGSNRQTHRRTDKLVIAQACILNGSRLTETTRTCKKRKIFLKIILTDINKQHSILINDANAATNTLAAETNG